MKIFTNCTLLDGTQDMKIKKNMTVYMDEEKIVKIQEGNAITEHGKIIDLNGRFLMPGLINMHAHLPSSGKPHKVEGDTAEIIQKSMKSKIGRFMMKKITYDSAKTQLMSGVTTVRTVGGLGDLDTEVRDEINSGKKTGPRILAGNRAISVPKGHMAGMLATIVTTKEEAVDMVRENAKEGVDIIKLMVTGGVMDATEPGEPGILRMSPEIIRAACDEAHRLGYKVAAHVESQEGVKAAIENGVDTIEHGSILTDELIKCFKKNHVAFICTISPFIPMLHFSNEMDGLSELLERNAKIVFEGTTKGAQEALANGIPVGLGTDNGTPYLTNYNMWRELEYFTQFVGVSPAFALHTATLVNAEIAGIADETGSVEVGKSADFLITEKNPLEDFSHMRDPYMVVMRGKVIRHPKIKKFKQYEEGLDRIRTERNEKQTF